MDISDKEIIKNYLRGDEKSLEVLIQKYLSPIYGFVFKRIGNADEAEDITQAVFIKVWKNVKKYDKNKSFKTWIFSIAKNTCIDYLRKKKAIPFSSFDNEKGENIIVNKMKDLSPLPNEIFEQKNFSKVLLFALEKLSDQYRIILYLRYKDNLKFKEIAQTLGESINTIKSKHRRAVLELKSLLPNNF